MRMPRFLWAWAHGARLRAAGDFLRRSQCCHKAVGSYEDDGLCLRAEPVLDSALRITYRHNAFAGRRCKSHLSCRHDANKACAEPLPECEDRVAHAIAGVGAPGDDGEIQANQVIKTHGLPIRCRHSGLNEHATHRAGLRRFQAMDKATEEGFFLLSHQAKKSAERCVARAV